MPQVNQLSGFKIFKEALCRLATSFVLFQNWQYITMNGVYLPSVFHGPTSPAIFCAKISSNDAFDVSCGRFGPAYSELQLGTQDERAPCLL